QAELKQEAAARARAEQQCQVIPALEQRLTTKDADIQALTQALSDSRSGLAELQARMEEERKATEDKLALLRNAEAQLVSQFENLAGKILEEKSQKFTEQNRAQLDSVLNPFREQIGDFRKKVDDMHLHDAKDRASLRQEIQGLKDQTQRINQEAANLARALKGDRKTQGNWGEMILERVLEQSGLRKGIEYDTQALSATPSSVCCGRTSSSTCRKARTWWWIPKCHCPPTSATPTQRTPPNATWP
ncbi:DNA recombination protein RmuC, partial [Methylogaea oryzae]|uniref:DNA recombination protein RmuC n=1 Tax=Methylogaea oryzae TaxID=1295382 RepID=UPI000ACBEED1